jgi:hypothetical protein
VNIITPCNGCQKDTLRSGLDAVVLDLPAGARWHGLRVSRLVVTHLDVDESDDQDQTDIVFAETPATVRRVLGEHGFDVPLAPAYRELDDNACGGSMRIETAPGGAALSCGFGC